MKFLSRKEITMKTTPTYTLGLDFGTLSVRALIVDTRDGRAVAEAVGVYEEMFGKYKKLYEYFGKR